MIPIPHRAWPAGAAAVLGFVVISTIDSLTRPEYSFSRHWISHLALGERGAIGMITIIVSGLLYIWFGSGLRAWSAWGSRLVILAGGALVIAGLSPIDPGLNYPPAVPAAHSTSGTVHDFAALVLVVALVGAAVVIGRATGQATAGKVIATLVVTTFIACSVLVALDYAGVWPGAPGGMLERLAIFGGMAWPVLVTARRQAPVSGVAAAGT